MENVSNNNTILKISKKIGIIFHVKKLNRIGFYQFHENDTFVQQKYNEQCTQSC